MHVKFMLYIIHLGFDNQTFIESWWDPILSGIGLVCDKFLYETRPANTYTHGLTSSYMDQVHLH